MHHSAHITNLSAHRESSALDRVRSGDSTGLAILYDLYSEKVFRTCFRILGERAAAEDLVQEIFIGLLGKLGHFRAHSKFSTWLYRVSVNQSLNALRARKRRFARFLPMPSSLDYRWQSRLPSPEKRAIEKESQDQVGRLLASLSPEHRVVIVLREIEGFSYQEIAEVLDLPMGTVMSRLSRARKALRKQWESWNEGNSSAAGGV